MSSSIGTAFRSALARTIVDNNLSVGQLQELLDEHPSLGSLTLAELFGGEAAARPQRTNGVKVSKIAKVTNGASTKTNADAWNVRTEEGRAALDAAVLATILATEDVSSEGVPAEALRRVVDVSSAQLRASLNRLIEAGQISYQGKARGTRYFPE